MNCDDAAAADDDGDDLFCFCIPVGAALPGFRCVCSNRSSVHCADANHWPLFLLLSLLW